MCKIVTIVLISWDYIMVCNILISAHFSHGLEKLTTRMAITPNMGYKGMVYKGEIWAVLKILGKLRVPSTHACSAKGFP